MPRHNRSRPTCTHLHMDKCYGDQFSCHLCGRYPSIGFIYVCQQDYEAKGSFGFSQQSLTSPHPTQHNTVIGDTTSALNDLSPWIVSAARSGHYTPAQLDLLKAQKQNLRNRIQEHLAAESTNEKAHPTRPSLNHALLAEKLAALDSKVAKSNESRKGKSKSKDKHKEKALSRTNVVPCDFKCCHTCRPVSRDRSFVSFEAVIENELKPPMFWNQRYMPVASAHIVRSIGACGGFGHPGIASSMNQCSTINKHSGERTSAQLRERREDGHAPEASAVAIIHRLRAKTSHENLKSKAIEIAEKQKTDDEAFRNSVRNSLRDFLIPDNDDASWDLDRGCSHDPDHKHKPDELPDYEVWKIFMEGLLAKAASIRVPDDGSSTESEKASGKLFAVSDEDHYIEGVAMTEESAETHAPDIIVLN